jgi:methylphosphotriester-DNA--protein-cysteine methyltransferase
MDVLSDVLRAVRLTGAIFFERHRTAPWVGASPHSAVIAAKVMPEAEHVINFAGAEVGYESEAAFSRAFKKYVGMSPGAWRRGRTPPATAETMPGL